MGETFRRIMAPLLAIGALAALSVDDLKTAYYYQRQDMQPAYTRTYEVPELRRYSTPTGEPCPEKYAEVLNLIENELGIPPGVMIPLVDKESGWNERAVSPTGARGLGQIQQITMKELYKLVHSNETRYQIFRFLYPKTYDFVASWLVDDFEKDWRETIENPEKNLAMSASALRLYYDENSRLILGEALQDYNAGSTGKHFTDADDTYAASIMSNVTENIDMFSENGNMIPVRNTRLSHADSRN